MIIVKKNDPNTPDFYSRFLAGSQNTKGFYFHIWSIAEFG
jgi:hypothetical protein